MNFQEHVRNLNGKVNQRTGPMWRIRSFISQDLAVQLYKSLIAPHFNYYSHIYDGCSLTVQRELQVSPNNALRAVMQVDSRYPIERLHENLNIELLDESLQKATCIEAYKIINGLAPSNLSNIVKQVKPVRHTRSGDTILLDCPKTRTKLGDSNFKVWAYKYWKTLPAELRCLDKLENFTSKIKEYDSIVHIR